MIMTIGNKDYKLEYSIEASLSDECISKVTGLMYQVYKAQTDMDIKELLTTGIVDVPQSALAIFYAGLLENHSDEIKSKAQAKELIKVWFKENKDASWFKLMQDMIDAMGDDGFFKIIGLEDFLNGEPESQTESESETEATKS